MRLFHKIFTIALLCSGALVPAARADEAPPAVKAFLANLERQFDAKPSYESLKTGADGTVTLTNLALNKPAQGEDPGLSLKTAEASFSGITDQGNSLYEIGKASFTNTTLQMTGKDVSMSATLPNASAEGWYIRAMGAATSPKDQLLASNTFAKRISSGPIAITSDGQNFSIGNVESSWQGDPATGAGKFAVKVNDVALPEALLALTPQGQMLKQLGYSTVNLDLASNGELTLKGDNIGYNFDLSLAGRDIGSLRFAASVDEVPLSVYTEITKAQSEGKPVDLAKLSPELQNVVVKDASVRFEDASIVKKLLPMLAAAQGMKEEVFVASIPPTVQLMVLQFQNEALSKQAVDAVTRFLADPKSITISAKPPATLKVSDFSAMDPNKPGDAITKMGVEVKAND